MKETVIIALNEREATKLKAAEALALRLKENGVLSSRVDIESNIVSRLIERSPKILVLDYLLGDYSTGIDVLLSLKAIPEPKRPKVFFLTDEPSVQVAVDAMKAGAVNYFGIENPQSLKLLVDEILNSLVSNNHSARPVAAKRMTLSQLVAQAPKSMACISQLQSSVAKKTAVTVLHGKPGSGLTTLAWAMHEERTPKHMASCLDLGLYDGKISSLFLEGGRYELPRLGASRALIIENVDHNDTELLTFLEKKQRAIWPQSGQAQDGAYLTILTSNDQVARSWGKLLNATVITVPALNERKEDFSALVQRFTRETEELSDLKLKPLTSEIVIWLSTLEWRGELKQLRAVLIDALIGHTLDGQEIKKQIELSRELWDSEHQQTYLPDRFEVASILELSEFNYRVAAARLGTTVQALRNCLANR